MTKKHEELAEEISLYVTRNVLHEWTGADRDCPMYFGRLDFERKDVEHLITLILSAVRDGLLLPDEVGRWTLEGNYEDIMGLLGGDILIALRPLTGTGKEKD